MTSITLPLTQLSPEQERLMAALDRTLALRRVWLQREQEAEAARQKAEAARAHFEFAAAELQNVHAFTAASAKGLIP